MGSLSLRAPVLQYSERLLVYLGLEADHVDYHEDHLLLLVRDLVEAEGGQVEFVVSVEHVLVGRQGVDHVEAAVLRVLVDFHLGRAAAHCQLSILDFKLYFCCSLA